MPYDPTWNNQYAQPATYVNYGQVPMRVPSYQGQQPAYQGQQGGYGHGRITADGSTEAYNRLLMMYQPSQLVPGFISDTVWDVNGRQFYSLSVEPDGRRNFEVFDYSPHVDQAPSQPGGAQFVSRQEYDRLRQDYEQFATNVRARLEVMDGVHAEVSPESTPTATGAVAGGFNDARQNTNAQEPGGRRP